VLLRRVKVLRLFWPRVNVNLDQLEEMLKGTAVGVLKEYRQAKPGAESALSILDEALQVKLSAPLAVLIHQLKWMH